ncbi:hypothetical protein ACIQMZ_24815 [Streptomyces longwoodensis]|uniref:hypothetical protein n=1 Tax=Streptomyces longwoodensis TaxID=68231 RepID=UPI003817BAD7
MDHNTPASEPASPPSPAVPRFGMPQAFVILGFVAATVVLTLAAHLSVRQIAVLLASAGGIGVVVLLTLNVTHESPGRRLLRRLLSAAANSGTGG